MQEVIAIGKRLVPLEQIAFVEPFDVARNPEFKPEREFKTRVVLLNRNTVLAEIPALDFAAAHGMHYLDEDEIGVNSAIPFQVETFMPTEDFKPEKPYQTRLKWHDREGREQSKLLLTKPETVIAMVLRGDAEPWPDRAVGSRRVPANRRWRRKARRADSASA